MTEQDTHGPGLRFPPPLLPVAVVGGAWLLHRWLPLPLGAKTTLDLFGILLVAVACVLIVVALLQFRRAQTHVEPWQPTTTVIQDGIFAYSRNPIYLAFCVATLGAAPIIDSWWVVIGLPALVYLLQVLVIRKEETYLEARFGDSYLDYKRRVRRWL